MHNLGIEINGFEIDIKVINQIRSIITNIKSDLGINIVTEFICIAFERLRKYFFIILKFFRFYKQHYRRDFI